VAHLQLRMLFNSLNERAARFPTGLATFFSF
jgi:hypothetical protein